MSEIISITLSGVIVIVMGIYIFFRIKALQEISYSSSENLIVKEDEKKNTNIEKLILRGDVELRLLEEITEIDRGRYFWYPRSKTNRELVLENINTELRNILRSSVDNDKFEEIQNRIFLLLDKISSDLKEIRQKKPFDGLDDPERSLLVDIVAEIPVERTIPLQKAHQLADIIKLKHQDIKRLQVENSKSASWTRWGTVGTISFGLLSLALSIYTIYK